MRPRSIPFQYISGSAYAFSAYMLYRSLPWSKGKLSIGCLS